MALSDLFQKWTQPYDGYTPQQVDTRRLLIAQMLNQGRQADSVGEGLVALAGGVLGGIQNRKLDRTEEAGRQSAEAAFNAAMGGWSPFAAPMMGSAGGDTLGTGGPLDSYANAIAGNESGGNYQAIGPQTRNGDRAYGKYQVMGANVGPWTEKYVGRRMSPQEFLADPQAQEAVFRGEFGSYVQQYGNPQDAASMWFSGKPLAQAGNASDGYMTVPDYVSKFTGQLGGGAGDTAVTGQAGADVLSGGSGNSTAIYQALANPWLSQEQRAALMQMLEQNDPLRQLQLQEAQMRIQQMQQPDVPAGIQELQWRAAQAGLQPGTPEYQQFIMGGGEMPGQNTPEAFAALDLRAQAAGLTPGSPEYQQFMLSGGKPTQGNWRPATPEEAAPYGAKAGQIGPDGRFYPAEVPQGMVIESDGQGGFRLVQGDAAMSGNLKPFTEAQSKDIGFATRAESALTALEPVANKLAELGDQVLGAMPFGLTRGWQESDYQLAEQAGRELMLAILRKDTGAAITPSEEQVYGEVYLPRYGDSPTVLERKAQARRVAVEALKAGMSPAQILAQGQALVKSGAVPAAVAPATGMGAPTAPGGSVLRFDAQGNLIQ